MNLNMDRDMKFAAHCLLAMSTGSGLGGTFSMKPLDLSGSTVTKARSMDVLKKCGTDRSAVTMAAKPKKCRKVREIKLELWNGDDGEAAVATAMSGRPMQMHHKKMQPLSAHTKRTQKPFMGTAAVANSSEKNEKNYLTWIKSDTQQSNTVNGDWSDIDHEASECHSEHIAADISVNISKIFNKNSTKHNNNSDGEINRQPPSLSVVLANNNNKKKTSPSSPSQTRRFKEKTIPEPKRTTSLLTSTLLAMKKKKKKKKRFVLNGSNRLLATCSTVSDYMSSGSTGSGGNVVVVVGGGGGSGGGTIAKNRGNSRNSSISSGGGSPSSNNSSSTTVSKFSIVSVDSPSNKGASIARKTHKCSYTGCNKIYGKSR